MIETLSVDINSSNSLNANVKTSNGLSGNINTGGSGGISQEYDPTVPQHVKNITQEDIDKWNSGGTSEESTFLYKDGDTFSTYAPFNANGLVTSSTKRVCFTVALPKRLDNINSITCDFLHAELRGLYGYLNDASGYKEYTNDTNYTITCTKSADNLVSIILNNPTGFTNVLNNTPIIIRLQLILTFHEQA